MVSVELTTLLTAIGAIALVGIVVVILHYPVIVGTLALLICILSVCFKLQSLLFK